MAVAGTRIRVLVGEVMVEAFRGVFGQLSLLLDVAWLPLLVLLAADILPGYLHSYANIPWPVWRGDQLGLNLENAIEAVAGLLCLTAFAVRWYQIALFSAAHPARPGLFLGAWLRFVLYTVLLYLIAALLILAMLLVDHDGVPDYVALLTGAAMMAAWLAPVRCMLLFPAAAAGKPLSIVAAWRSLGGNTWRLFVAVMLVTIPVVFVTAMVVSAFFAGFHIEAYGDKVPPLGFFLLRSVLSTCGNVLVVALCASAIAGFYRRLDDAAV
ncbi:MAG TPA: hypothetical protein VG328_20100 [Stellaceae bacterium]|nr:hypothetical protein [Stellaceae bacterium]